MPKRQLAASAALYGTVAVGLGVAGLAAFAAFAALGFAVCLACLFA